MADMLNINQLRTFVAVAEHGSFTDAAKERFIAQSAVSKHISALEQALDTQLLLRDTHTVRLTPAGEIFYQDCKEILRRMDLAVDHLTNPAGGASAHLSVAVFSVLSEHTVALVRAFLQDNPKVDLRLEWFEFGELIRRVEQGQIDIGVTIGFVADARPQMRRKTIEKGRMSVMLGARNPLASRESLRFQDLEGMPYFAMEPHVTPDGYVTIVRYFADRKFPVNMISRGSHESTVLELQCRDDAFGMMGDFEYREHPGIVFVPLAEEDQPQGDSFDLVAMWRADNQNPCIPAFLAEIDRLYPQTE